FLLARRWGSEQCNLAAALVERAGLATGAAWGRLEISQELCRLIGVQIIERAQTKAPLQLGREVKLLLAGQVLQSPQLLLAGHLVARRGGAGGGLALAVELLLQLIDHLRRLAL